MIDDSRALAAPLLRIAPAAERPHVAVIMSVHKAAPLGFLQESIESLLAQTYRPIDIFVMRDGPQRPEVDAYLEGFPPGELRLLRFDQNHGLAAALNEMLDAVVRSGRYAYVARMDADDVSDPRRFERQVEYLEANPEIGLLGTWCEEMDASGKTLFLKELPTEHDAMLRIMATRSPLVHPSIMARTAIFAGGTRYDPALRKTEDYDLWSRLAFEGVRMANLPEPLLRFRMDANFYSRRGGWERAWREVEMKYQHLRRFRRRTPWNLLMLGGVLALRLSPEWAKKLAYRFMR